MRRSNRGIGEGVAFTALIISASAMDSDSRVLPAVICLGAVSALFWMGQARRRGKRKSLSGAGSIKKEKINILVFILPQGKGKSNENLQDVQGKL